jgi:hypothetical protein
MKAKFRVSSFRTNGRPQAAANKTEADAKAKAEAQAASNQAEADAKANAEAQAAANKAEADRKANAEAQAAANKAEVVFCLFFCFVVILSLCDLSSVLSLSLFITVPFGMQ